ncbi:MAG: hypothetical protein QOH06_1620 [Acidobacteriota bacterium]|jgi:hypothetical protein|nr:hypothetical protein [Acidobacteriota bacterium]
MTREEYEERRRAFEEQHRADVALMNAAQEARIRSLDRLWQEALDGERPAGSPIQPAPGHSPAQAPAPAPAPKPMRPRNSVINDLEEALPQLPQIFDRQDIVRALGYKPAPTTLFSALNRLRQEGAIAPENYSEGGTKVRYRKLA